MQRTHEQARRLAVTQYRSRDVAERGINIASTVRMRRPDATGRRRFVGVLLGAQAGQVSLELEGRTVALGLEEVERARLVPEL